jgi:DNA-binding transcriptional LysR family regulator
LHNVDGSDAAPIPFLNYSPDAFLGKVTASLLRDAMPKLNLELRYESAFAEALRAQTLTGAGISWLPRSLVAGDLKAGRLVLAGSKAPQAVLEIWMYKSKRDVSSSADELWAKASQSTYEKSNNAKSA